MPFKVVVSVSFGGVVDWHLELHLCHWVLVHVSSSWLWFILLLDFVLSVDMLSSEGVSVRSNYMLGWV